MAALKATVESLDAVDEQYRGLYKQTDKGFRLDAEGIEFEDEVVGLKTALQREREEAKRLSKRLKELPDDFDAEKWTAMSKAEQERAEKEARDKGEWDNLKKQIQDSHAKELAKKDERVGALESQLNRLLVDNVAATAIAKLEGSTRLLLPHVQAMTRVVEDDGERKVVVVDEKGNRRLNNKGDDMSIEELVGEMRESDDFASAFKGSGAAGGGAASRGAAGGGNRSKFRTKADFTSVADKVAFIREYGKDAFEALPNAA